jgi:hypothetical protein
VKVATIGIRMLEDYYVWLKDRQHPLVLTRQNAPRWMPAGHLVHHHRLALCWYFLSCREWTFASSVLG